MSGIGADFIIKTTEAAITVGRRYRRMRLEYNEYLDDVGYNEWAFKSNVKALLRSILHDEAQIESLVQDPGGDAWQQNDMQILMQGRLQDSRDFYLQTVKRMNLALRELKEKLGLYDDDVAQQQQSATVNGSAASEPPSILSATSSKLKEAKTRLDNETFRLKFSASETVRLELRTTIQKCNARLKRILDLVLLDNERPRTHILLRTPNQEVSAMQSALKRVHQSSITLYRAIQGCWKCECQEYHHGNLRLEHRAAEEQTIFRTVFTSSPPLALQAAHWSQRSLDFMGKTACLCSRIIHQQSSRLGPQQLAQDVELCQRLRHLRGKDHCVGTVSYGDEAYHVNAHFDFRGAGLSLEDIMSGQNQPTRRSRYRLALLLASSVAQLQFSPWLPQGLSRTDIIFLPPWDSNHENVSDMHRQPFIQQGFPAAHVTDLDNKNYDEWAFHKLGIRLLELCFGTTVESHHAYPKGLEVPEADKSMICMMVAKSWARSVADEAGQDYSQAVEWCLDGGSGKFLIESESWRDEMIRKVVIPLQRCYQQSFGKLLEVREVIES